MKKITYNFINPNTDDELATYISEILSKAIAEKFVYGSSGGEEFEQVYNNEYISPKPQDKIASSS